MKSIPTKTITEKELELLFPSEEFVIAGHTFNIKPFNFFETKQVAEKLQNVMHIFYEDVDKEVYAAVLSVAYDGIRDVIAMSLNIKPELVDKFDNKSAMQAIVGIIKVNKDFFMEEVYEEAMKLKDLTPDDSPTES